MRDNVILLAGVDTPDTLPWSCFDPRAVDFLAELSAEILRSPDTRRQEATAAFGFWCRRNHIEALAQRHAVPLPRLGRGLVFHVAPSNVPALFAYTMAIGLLAGNANIVRLSSRCIETEAVLLNLLRRVLERHPVVQARTALITCDRDDAAVAACCARCDARVVWGGDAAVAALRAMPVPPHAVELMFPDRWSLAVLSQSALSALDTQEREVLAHRFYNDTYQMDQNACSSPQLVLWLEDGGSRDCRRLWWETVAAEAEAHYPLGPFQAARKLERLCLCAMKMAEPPITAIERYRGNYLYVAELERLPKELKQLRGGFGLFFQSTIASLEELLPLLSPEMQTLTCGGLDPRQTACFLAKHRAKGIDRVVPLGQALEIDTIWDGKDMIATLSRMIG